MNLAYISFSWQSYLKFEVNFQTPLNLKNPASQMIPQCQRKHTHIRESNTRSIQDVPEPRTKNLVLHGGRSSDEGHFLFLFLLLVILGQLLISCKGWKEGGSAELQLSQREQIWAVSWGQGRGLWVKMGSGGGRGLQRPEHFLSPVFPKSTVIIFHGLKLWICVCILLFFDWWEKKTNQLMM